MLGIRHKYTIFFHFAFGIVQKAPKKPDIDPVIVLSL